MQKVYGDQICSRAMVFKWFKRLQDANSSLRDLPRSGRPKTGRTEVNINTVAAVIGDDPGVSLNVLSSTLNLSRSVVHNILTEDLDMRHRCCTWVPHFLTREQKEKRVAVCRELLEMSERSRTWWNE